MICKNCKNLAFIADEIPIGAWEEEINCCTKPDYLFFIHGDPEYDKENRGFDVVDGVVERKTEELEISRDNNKKTGEGE